MRNITILVGVAILGIVFAATLMDEAEVVTLTTRDDRDREYETGLWIVELTDGLYLRAESAEAPWLERIRADPEVSVTRGGETVELRAVPIEDPAVRKLVNSAMTAKYGRVNRALGILFDASKSVPIRLEKSVVADAAKPEGFVETTARGVDR